MIAGDGARIAVEPARNGQATLRIDGRYVHSRHDPEREALRATAELCRREPPSVLMLGLGLGYHARGVLSRTEETKLVVYEPSDEVIRLAGETGPPGAQSDSRRLFITSSTDRLAALLAEHAADGFEIFELSGRSADEAAFDEARAIAASFSSRVEINHNTLHRFGKLWVRNLCRNLPQLAVGRSITALRDAFAGVPTLLLAAGPTLDQVLPILPQLARRCAVIAVDTALAPAVRSGIEPDFAVVVDPQYWNARHLDRVRLPDTILVSEPSAHPHVFRSFPASIYFCSSVFPLGKAFETRLGRFGPLGAGGSVSTSAWDLARLIGSPSVAVAGLDLGFPGGRTHCAGSFFEELALTLADRTTPAEGVIFRYARGAGPEEVADNDGSTLLSDRRMAIYRNWFASQLRQTTAPRTSSVTRGGCSVEGLHLQSPSDLLALPEIRTQIDARRRAIFDLRPPDSAGRRLVLREEALSIQATVEDLAGIADRAARLVRGIRGHHRAGRPADFSALRPLDARLSGHPAGAIGSFLIQQAITRIRSGYGSTHIDEQIDASLEIYEGLAEAAEFHAAELGKAVWNL